MDSLDGLSLRQLRCFLATCESRSVVQAARALGITQSAASRRIADLEARIGTPLFDRAGRRMEPTAAAAPLRAAAEAALTGLRHGVEATRGDLREAVAIGALPSVAGTLVPQALLSLQKAWPRLHLRVETGTGDHLLQQLRSGALDVVIGRMGSPSALAELSFAPLYRDRLGAFVRPGHPLTRGDIQAPSLFDYPMILPPASAVVRATVDAFLLARGIPLSPVRIEKADPEIATALLVETNAIWFIARDVGITRVAAGVLDILPVETDDTLGDTGLTIRASDPPSTALRDVLAALRAVALLRAAERT